MLQEKLTLPNLAKLEFGLIQETFDRELTRIVKDCDERPLDDKSREVTIKFKLAPVADTSGGRVVCDHIDVEVEVAGKVPVNRTKVYAMKPRQDGSIVFHPDLPDEPEGSTLYDPDQTRKAS